MSHFSTQTIHIPFFRSEIVPFFLWHTQICKQIIIFNTYMYYVFLKLFAKKCKCFYWFLLMFPVLVVSWFNPTRTKRATPISRQRLARVFRLHARKKKNKQRRFEALHRMFSLCFYVKSGDQTVPSVPGLYSCFMFQIHEVHKHDMRDTSVG